MKLFPKILTVATSVLLAAGSLAVAPIGANQSASAETIISQLGSDIDGAAANDNSGSSVSLSSDGTRVAIGAPYNDGTSSNAGHVKVYEYSGGTWNQLGSDIEGEAAGDNSGYSVSLSSDGTRVAIGAYGNDGSRQQLPVMSGSMTGTAQLGLRLVATSTAKPQVTALAHQYPSAATAQGSLLVRPTTAEMATTLVMSGSTT